MQGTLTVDFTPVTFLLITCTSAQKINIKSRWRLTSPDLYIILNWKPASYSYYSHNIQSPELFFKQKKINELFGL